MPHQDLDSLAVGHTQNRTAAAVVVDKRAAGRDSAVAQGSRYSSGLCHAEAIVCTGRH